jgi:hypothetical protein
MRTLAFCAAVVAFWPIPLFAQQQHQTSALDPCEVITTPEKYGGRIVELRGIIYSSFEDFSMGGTSCKDLPDTLRIWLAFPDEVEVKSDPTLQGKQFTFKRDKVSKQFDHYLDEKCGIRRVLTTLRGWLEYKPETATYHPNGNIASTIGYGHMGMHHLRLVILSVVQAEKFPCSP